MENIKQEAIDTNLKTDREAKWLQRDELEQVKSFLSRANNRMKAANILHERYQNLSEMVLELLLEKFSRKNLFREGTGHEYVDRMEIDDIQFCIGSLVYCLISGNSKPIEDNLISKLKENPEAFWFSAEGLIAAFNCLRENHGLTDEAKDAANEYIEGAIAALTQLITSQLKIPEKSEILTLEEIKEKYPQQWVLIAYTERDEYLNVIRGEVLASSPDCDEIEDYLPHRNGKAVAIEYTGPIPEEIGMFM